MGKKVVVQKIDLDTALTAYILGVNHNDEIVVVQSRASEEDLADPSVICIECGGSGQVDLNNFDHHDTELPLPPACVQAYLLTMADTRFEPVEQLVEYVAILDTQGGKALRQYSNLPAGAFPTLSDVFSGMLLTTESGSEQLIRGLDIIHTIVDRRIDPFGIMPGLPEWRTFIDAKRANDEKVQKVAESARFFTTNAGLKAGYIETDVPGVVGVLYTMGCDIAIAYSPNFRIPGAPAPIPKYTIAGNGVRVDGILKVLNDLDPGWGGPSHGTIIGSPRSGSKLPLERVVEIVRTFL